MTIEIPIDVWDPGRGGAERCLGRLVRGLLARGHKVRVLCLRSRGEVEGPGLERLEVETLDVPRWPRFLREVRFARAALARRRAGGADVTLAVRHLLEADVYQPHGGPFKKAVRASLEHLPPVRRAVKLALRLSRPVVWALLHAERKLLRSPGLILVSLSKMVEEDFRRAYPGTEFRFERIYNGVDLGEFHDWDRAKHAAGLRSRFAIPSGERVALFVGHKFGPKGLAEAVRAVAAVPRLHLLVLGSGRPEPFLRLARAAGAADRIHFAGATADPLPFYAGAEVLLHPTWYDPCSLAVLEALAAGLPVVTTRANGAGELLENGREGFVVERGDVAALKGAVEAVLGAWDRFHAAALARARDLSFERHLEKMEEVLGKAASERRIREGREGTAVAAGR